MKRFRALLLVTAAGVTAAAGEALASGFMIRENSAESLATAFAGNASRADEPATAFNNPAGMSWLSGTQTQVGATVVFPSIHFDGQSTAYFPGPNPGDPPTAVPVPADNSRNDGQIAAIPHMYVVYDLGQRWKGGLALTIPFGNTVDYSEGWSGRYVNIKTAALSFDINPSVSFKVTDRFAIAAGVSLQYLKLDLSSQIAQFVIFNDPTLSVPDGGFLLSVHNWDWGFNLGALAEPWEGTKLGVAFRSGIDHHADGSLTFTPAYLGVSGPASTELAMPASITGSFTQQIGPRFSLSSDVQYAFWNTFGDIVVESPPNLPTVFHEGYRDSWMVSIGGVYRVNDALTLRGGIGYDQSPVVDEFRDTGVPDKDRYMVGIGFGYQFSPSAGIDVGYAHYFAAGHATMNESVNRIDATGAVILNGRYDNHLDYVSVSIRAAL